MVVPIVEIVKFTASEAHKANPAETIRPVLDILASRPGQIKIYHGFETENPDQYYVFTVWDTYESHKALMDDAPTFTAFLSDFSKCTVGRPTIYHVQPRLPPFPALDAPVLELAYFKLRTGNESDFEELVKTTHELTALEVEGVHLAVPGSVKEDTQAVAFFVGWESMEAHLSLAADKSSKAASLVPKLFSLAEGTAVHVNLKAA